MYNDAGVNIHIHKFPFGPTDEEIDFNFQIAKALGCMAHHHRSAPSAMAKKLAPFAEKHKIWVAFHNHTDNFPTLDRTDPILEIGPYIGFNFDIGHYFAGTKGQVADPGDREVPRPHRQPAPEGPDRRRREPPVGPGQTPIKEVLQLLKKEKWPIYADIELEYKIPAGSTPWPRWPSASDTARRRSPEKRLRCRHFFKTASIAPCVSPAPRHCPPVVRFRRLRQRDNPGRGSSSHRLLDR